MKKTEMARPIKTRVSWARAVRTNRRKVRRRRITSPGRPPISPWPAIRAILRTTRMPIKTRTSKITSMSKGRTTNSTLVRRDN